MTLTEKINSNPYLKVSNCTDIADIEYALTECKRLLQEYGSKRSLCTILAKLEKKKEQLEGQKSASNLHPIFEQALKPFGIK